MNDLFVCSGDCDNGCWVDVKLVLWLFNGLCYLYVNRVRRRLTTLVTEVILSPPLA